MRVLVIAVTLVVANVPETAAEVRRLVEVGYIRADGTISEPYRREIQFVTGRELKGDASTNFRPYTNYDPYENYALVWFGPGEVAILALSPSVLTANRAFSDEDFKRTFMYGTHITASQANDPYGEPRRWYLIAKDDAGRWIDPRVDGRSLQAPSPSPSVPERIEPSSIPRRLPVPPVSAPPQSDRPPERMYVIPGCYAGNKPPPPDLKCKPPGRR